MLKMCHIYAWLGYNCFFDIYFCDRLRLKLVLVNSVTLSYSYEMNSTRVLVKYNKRIKAMCVNRHANYINKTTCIE